MRDLGLISFGEPVKKLLTQGMVTLASYRCPEHDWIFPAEVIDGKCKFCSQPVATGRVEKMSKSKKNTVDPLPMFDQFGADAVRWFMLSDSPPERDLPWSEAGIEGTWRFVQRIWRLVEAVGDAPTDRSSRAKSRDVDQVQGVSTSLDKNGGVSDPDLERQLHRAIAGVGADIEALGFNKAVAKIHALANAIEKAAPSASRSAAIRTLVLLIAPMLPHLAEEAWEALGGTGLIAHQLWPTHDPALLVESQTTIAIQVSGKLRDTLTVAKDATRDELEAAALASEKVIRTLNGATPKKVIVVPGRLVNIVI